MGQVYSFRSADRRPRPVPLCAAPPRATHRSSHDRRLRLVSREGQPLPQAFQGSGEPDADTASVDRVRRRPCPRCGSTRQPLNAFRIATEVNYMVLESPGPELVVGCPRCVAAAARRALGLTLGLGWLGDPRGVADVIRAVRLDLRALTRARHRLPTPELREYVEGLESDRTGDHRAAGA